MTKSFTSGTVEYSYGGFDCYDKNGEDLGSPESQEEAEFMVENDFRIRLPEVAATQLVAIWNNLIETGYVPVEDKSGNQYFCLYSDVVMVAKIDGEFDLTTLSYLWANHKHETFNVLTLRKAKNPRKILS